MELMQRIEAFTRLGAYLLNQAEQLNNEQPAGGNSRLPVQKAYQKNPWFTPDNIQKSCKAIGSWLNKPDLEKWISAYNLTGVNPKNVGVIMAGNIPLVGFHDFLCVLMSAHSISVKCSSDDEVLLPAIAEWMINDEPEWKEKIRFVERLEKPDAVIATGSNNSSRYFEYYFGKYPNIIRKNRNSVAVLKGDESKGELENLGSDIFSYFGLGCRNVSKLYIQEGYSFDAFFQAMEKYAEVRHHNKYINNHDYHSAIFLLNKVTFLTNNFLILREHEALATPVSVIHYEYYNDEKDLHDKLKQHAGQIQCIAGKDFIPFGKTQQPGLTDYADGVDVMKWLVASIK
jgi:hypothetical protein